VRCGKVGYSFPAKEDKLDTVICHCHNCQRFSGSAFSLLVGVNKSDLKFHGPVKTYTETGTLSGKPSSKHFCGECGASLVREPGLYLPTVFVCAGTINDEQKKFLQTPGADIWTDHKLACISQSSAKSVPGNL